MNQPPPEEPDKLQARQLEAIKFLKDWSTWMAGIQAALIAYLSSAATTPFPGPSFPIRSTLFFFTASIVFAGLLLGGLPAIIEEEPPETFTSVYERQLRLSGMPTYRVGSLVIGQHACFLLGLLTLLIDIMFRP